jgi:hypothetical protein
MMRFPLSALVVLFAVAARADCPPDCVPGGGPKATDCYLQWTGLATLTPEPCADGSACDADGEADGACTFPLQACVGAGATDGCTPASLSGAPLVKPAGDPAGQALAAALAGLGASGCTPARIRVPLKVSLKGIKNGVAKLKVTASAGGRRDTDKLRLTCTPAPNAPSFAAAVQPIFTSKCAVPTCHVGTPILGLSAPNLEAGNAYEMIVGQRGLQSRKTLVQPGSLKKSYLAAKILGQKLMPGTLRMPQGCPNGPLPPGGCLDEAQTFTILHWIQRGAPDN